VLHASLNQHAAEIRQLATTAPVTFLKSCWHERQIMSWMTLQFATHGKKKWSLFGARIGLEPQRIMNWKSRTDNNQSQECDLSSLFLMIVRCTCVSVVWEREAILLLSFCFYFEPYDDILEQKKEEYKALQENWDLSLPGTPRKSEKCRWWTFNFRGVSFIVLSLQPSLLFEQKTRLKWETQGLALPENR